MAIYRQRTKNYKLQVLDFALGRCIIDTKTSVVLHGILSSASLDFILLYLRNKNSRSKLDSITLVTKFVKA